MSRSPSSPPLTPVKPRLSSRQVPPPSPLRSTNLPVPPHSPLPQDGRERKASGSKARDLLRKHYGLGVGVPQPSGKERDPMDLDSAAFDARAYYDQLITTASLPTLLKRENELVSEIRQLDGERQALVYNHHHELIAASDTIAAMKTRAESLDADLDLLRAAFSEISRLGAEVAVEHPHAEKNP